MAKRADLPAPIMGRGTSFHSDKASLLQLCKELQHLRSSELAAHSRTAIMGDGVNLEHVLGQIEANYSDSRIIAQLPRCGAVHPITSKGVITECFDAFQVRQGKS